MALISSTVELTTMHINSAFTALCTPIIIGLLSTLSMTSHAEAPSIQELNWRDQKHLEAQRSRIDDILRENYGRPIRQDKTDLDALQRIIDDNLIARDDTLTLQAMGAIIGDLYAAEEKLLVWRIYHDSTGRTRAVCVKDTHHCIFPVTMLSRRIETGARPDVKRVYNIGLEIIQRHLPYRPFSNTSSNTQ